MKKLFSVAVIVLCSMVVFSCKNNGNKCESECGGCTEATEQCCGNHEGGECTKAEGEECCGNHEGGECNKPDAEKCDKCKAKAAAAE